MKVAGRSCLVDASFTTFDLIDAETGNALYSKRRAPARSWPPRSRCRSSNTSAMGYLKMAEDLTVSIGEPFP